MNPKSALKALVKMSSETTSCSQTPQTPVLGTPPWSLRMQASVSLCPSWPCLTRGLQEQTPLPRVLGLCVTDRLQPTSS